jgi:cation diffusion facilitator family transporter
MARSSSRRVIYAALLGNFLVAVTKFAAAAYTGSSAMVSEAVHSLADTGNELLLLYGLRRAARPPDNVHPFGYGRELYFWSFIVALLIFTLGAGVSVYEGIEHLRHPVPIKNPRVNYLVLGLAILFEGGSWWVALKAFRATKGDEDYLAAVRESKDPPRFMVLLEDSAALVGNFMALFGTLGAEALRRPALDGVASLGIGVLLAGVALLLAGETKELLIGEAARPEILTSICAMARSQPGIEHANGLLTIHLGPYQIAAALSVDFTDDLRAREVEQIVATLEQRIQQAHPEIVILLIKPQSIADFQRSQARRIRASVESVDGPPGGEEGRESAEKPT